MDGSPMQTAIEEPDADLQTPAAWSGRITAMERERQQAEGELARIVAERRALASIDHCGDRAAMAQTAARIGWLNARHSKLLVEIDNLEAGKSVAGEQLGAALEGRQRGRSEVRQGDPATLAKAILAQAERVDDALVMLVDALNARRVLARRLAGIGKLKLHLIENGTRLRAAVAHHGARDFLEMAPSAPRLYAPLRDADEMLLRHLLAPPAPRGAAQIRKEAIA